MNKKTAHVTFIHKWNALAKGLLKNLAHRDTQSEKQIRNVDFHIPTNHLVLMQVALRYIWSNKLKEQKYATAASARLNNIITYRE